MKSRQGYKGSLLEKTLGLNPLDLRQLQALLDQSLQELHEAVAEVVMRFDA